MQTKLRGAGNEEPSLEEAEQTQALIASLRGFMLARDPTAHLSAAMCTPRCTG